MRRDRERKPFESFKSTQFSSINAWIERQDADYDIAAIHLDHDVFPASEVFRVGALRAAMAGDPERVAAATDEAMLIEAAGGKVLIHDPGAPNLKITPPVDLRVAELLLAEREP